MDCLTEESFYGFIVVCFHIVILFVLRFKKNDLFYDLVLHKTRPGVNQGHSHRL